MVLPQARAGAIFHVAMTAGKFHGVIRAHTPTGSRRVTSRPGSWTGMVSPKILLAAPPQYSRVVATRSISPFAAVIGLPPFRASTVARSSSRSRTSADARRRTRPRSVALSRGHGPSSNPRWATPTASRTSSGPASATSAIGLPVAGSITGDVPPSFGSVRRPPTSSRSDMRSSFPGGGIIRALRGKGPDG
jgi:hypothetical protein